ncbi:hypothetical protein [Pseudorhizobium flavum]|jgi:hypothetical protein|uniref:Uncharacterized protein n=1 Tax=Pseudorhizobium flavum TaxID=1335061 RepID=A0A7W9YU57_9HYPH|nr:hypothetical protein [Pseudorhizobium flavum]MBB6178467.1 hypothetical protein [Pseudorhizobium flavum]CAD6602279.1 hypothetical protein RKHAN_01084 [Rhizobium sp. Khangiran2]CAD6611363.1 hypothetical protein RFYW14_02390 [Pseudorhizobium flavum]
MIASNSMPVPQRTPTERTSERARLLDTPDMIEHLADELRSRSDPCLPKEYYLEQVRRQLAGRTGLTNAAAREQIFGRRHMPLQSASVFHAWALRD